MELAQVAKLAAAGDEQAWNSLVRHFVAGLRNWLVPRVEGFNVDEVVHDVVIVVENKLTSLATGSDEDFVRGLHTIACVVKSVWRREAEEANQPARKPAPGDKEPAPWLLPYLIRGNRLLAVFEELGKLPEFQRRKPEATLEPAASKTGKRGPPTHGPARP